MAVATPQQPAPRREPSTPTRRPTRRSWVCPRVKSPRAGAQMARRSTAGARARRAPPMRPPGLKPRPAPQARPTTLRARPEAAGARRPAGPTRAVRLRALPTTEVAPPEARPVLRGRLPIRAVLEAAQPRAAEAVGRRRGAVEVALQRAGAVEARPPAAVRLRAHRARPRLETELLCDVRPLWTSACSRVSQAAAHPTRARVGPSPRSVALLERVRPRADPSSGWRQAAEASARPSTPPSPVEESRLVESRPARPAAGPAGSQSPCATVMRAGRHSCFSCPWSECGEP